MSEEVKNEEQTNTGEDQGRTYSQQEFQAKLDAAIKERLGREKKKFADYDELKAKAAKLDEIEEANKTELQKAQDRIAELEAANEARLAAEKKAQTINDIAKEYRVPDELKALLTADDEDELKAQAELLGSKFAEASTNDGKEPADIDAPKDEMDEFFEQLSEVTRNY